MGFFVTASKPEDWQPYLAEPKKQWADGHSAKALACCWMGASGFPDSVKSAFEKSEHSIFNRIEFLAGFIEHKVPLPGRGHQSQNDILVLAKNNQDFVVIAVEEKVSEPFGETLGEWLRDSSLGKKERLMFLSKLLGVDLCQAKETRYQLAHRTASALIEAERFNAAAALMLVHSFSPTDEWFKDYSQFASLFGIQARLNTIHHAKRINSIELYLAWVSEDNA